MKGRYNGIIYYSTRKEAELLRESGECIYYVSRLGYCIIKQGTKR